MSARVSRLSLVAVALPLLTLASCGLLKKGGGADASADADTATEDASTPTITASNDADLTHPADEAKIDPPEDTKIEGWSAVVKAGPGTGSTVATLTKGTAVQKIASHDKYFLVLFDSPKDSSKKVAGWVTGDVFTAHAVIILKDAGAKSVDGGASKDGGGALVPPSLGDASAPPQPTASGGGGVPTAPPGSVEVAPTNGVCPADFSKGMDGRCHKNCSSSPSVCGAARCSSKCGTPGPACITPMSSCAH